MRFGFLFGLFVVLIMALCLWVPRMEVDSTASAGLVRREGVQVSTRAIPEVIQQKGGASSPIRAAEREIADHPNFLPGTIWAEGRVHFPPGYAAAHDTRVWGLGAKWPDGDGWYGAEVAADGSFRMAFAEGTEVGRVNLQHGNCFAGVESYRVWQKNSIEVKAKLGRSVVVQVVGRGIDLEELDYSLTWGQANPMPLMNQDAHAYRLAIDKHGTGYLNVLGLDFPVLPLEVKGGEAGTAQAHELVIENPARITGRLIASEGEKLVFPWVNVQLVAEPHKEGRRGETVYVGQEKVSASSNGSVYAYSIEVPAGYSAWVTGNANGCSTKKVVTDPLISGLTYELEDSHLSAQGTILLGRLVDLDRQPIAGARIRAEGNWNASGAYLSDPARCADHEVQTDSRGAFSMQTHQFGGHVIQALVPAKGEVIDENASEFLQGVGIQFFEVKTNGNAVQEFVFNPVREGLQGIVRGPSGEAVKDFVVECELVPPDSNGRLFGCTVRLVSPSPYLPAGVDRRDWASRRYYNRAIQIRCHSETGGFHLASLPPGTWRVTVRGDGYTADHFPEVAVPNDEPLKVGLDRSGRAVVEVRNFREEVRVGVEVMIHPAGALDLDIWRSLDFLRRTTDEAGQALMEHLPAGRYSLVVKPSGSNAQCAVNVEVVAGKTIEVLLQPQPSGEIRLVSPWPDSSIRVGPQLVGIDNDGTYSFPMGHLNQRLHLRDVAPGTYRLSYSFQSEKAKKLVEPIVQIKSGERTDVPIQINPGFVHVSGQVYVNGQPSRGGKLHIDYTEASWPQEKLYVGSGRFFAFLRNAMPSRIMRELDYKRIRATEWGRPSEGRVWEIHLTLIEVKLALPGI